MYTYSHSTDRVGSSHLEANSNILVAPRNKVATYKIDLISSTGLLK